MRIKCWWLLHKTSSTSHRPQRTFLSTILQGTELIKTKNFYLTGVVPKVMACLYDTKITTYPPQVTGDVLSHLCNSPWLVHFWWFCTSFDMPLWQVHYSNPQSCMQDLVILMISWRSQRSHIRSKFRLHCIYPWPPKVKRAVRDSTLLCCKLKCQFINNLSQSANWHFYSVQT